MRLVQSAYLVEDGRHSASQLLGLPRRLERTQHSGTWTFWISAGRGVTGDEWWGRDWECEQHQSEETEHSSAQQELPWGSMVITTAIVLICTPYHDNAERMPSYTNRAPPGQHMRRQHDLFHIFIPPNPPLQMILLPCPSFPRLIRMLLLHPQGWDCSITRPGACSCDQMLVGYNDGGGALIPEQRWEQWAAQTVQWRATNQRNSEWYWQE